MHSKEIFKKYIGEEAFAEAFTSLIEAEKHLERNHKESNEIFSMLLDLISICTDAKIEIPGRIRKKAYPFCQSIQ